MVIAKRLILQKVFISVPHDLMGNVTREINQRRGTILDIKTEGDMSIINEPKHGVIRTSGVALRACLGATVLRHALVAEVKP